MNDDDRIILIVAVVVPVALVLFVIILVCCVCRYRRSRKAKIKAARIDANASGKYIQLMLSNTTFYIRQALVFDQVESHRPNSLRNCHKQRSTIRYSTTIR